MKLKVCAQIYNLFVGGKTVNKKLFHDNLEGQVRHSESIILVADEIPQDSVTFHLNKGKVLHTLIHEIYHAASENYGIKDSEKNADLCASIIYQILSDNKKVIMALLEKYL